MSEDKVRPNIRIEIHNNLADEAMEVDEVAKGSENEDGEISDNYEAEPSVQQKTNKDSVNVFGSKKVWPNNTGTFTTGINIFDKEEQTKLMERAKRFKLKPSEITNFTDEELQQLHDSLGISSENEKDVRFEAIHMRGTDEMSTEDIFEYFGKYAPAVIEWINDESCNVVWLDKISTARALFFLSSPIRGMPVEGPCDPFVKELNLEELETPEDSGRSILLKNKDREVELQDDTIDDKENSDETVHVSELKVPVPPGYWRLGVEHPKSKCILLRFSFKTDKKPYRAEKFSQYYKKYGNPNFGGVKGLISESLRLKNKGIFDRNRDITKKSSKSVDDNKNPWGALAENWDEDVRYAERVVVPHKPPKPVTKPVEESSIMNRLGFKRAHVEPEETEEAPAPEKKTKIPRMRMYADEEEEKIKRRKKLMAVKMQAGIKQEDDVGKHSDLRTILKPVRSLGVVNNQGIADEIVEDYHAKDLGSRLKNRTRRPVVEDYYSYSEMQPLRITREIDNKDYLVKEKPPKSNRIRKDTPPRKLRPSRYDTLHSDRYEPDRSRRTKESYYEEEFDSHKPRSKVAIVIKTQKKPSVASKVKSRLASDREDLIRNASVKSRVRRDSSSSSDDSSSVYSSSSNNSSSSATSDSESERPGGKNRVGRPGFRSDYMKKPLNHKSPLRIEISNDHFKKE